MSVHKAVYRILRKPVEAPWWSGGPPGSGSPPPLLRIPPFSPHTPHRSVECLGGIGGGGMVGGRGWSELEDGGWVVATGPGDVQRGGGIGREIGGVDEMAAGVDERAR